MKKALIIQNKFIGDVLVSSLIAKNLKKLSNNQIEIHFFCYEPAKGILSNNPYIDKIISFDDKKLKNLFELFKIIIHLRSEHYSILIDPYGKLQSRIITLFSGARIKSSIKKPFFKLFYTHTYREKFNSEIYDCTAIENRLILLNPFNITNRILDDKIEFFLTSTEIQYSKKLLKEQNILSKPIVMIGILGSSKEKSWPSEYMAELVNFILDKYNCNVLLNYMPNQKKEIKEIISEISHSNSKLFIKPLANNIRELAGLIHFCKAYIGNEGGAINLAKSLNVPTFSIYSPHKFRREWGCYERNSIHRSVHLKDICPELYRNIYIKDLYKQTELLYTKLRYSYVKEKLQNFIDKIVIKKI